MARRAVALVALCLLAVACGTTPSEALRARAASDFACDKNEITLIALDNKPYVSGEAADWASSVAVSGCGKSASYIRVHGEWTKNNNEAAPPPPVDQSSPDAGPKE